MPGMACGAARGGEAVPRVVAPIVGRDDQFFWDGVAAGEFRVQRCRSCSRLRHPHAPMCGDCGSLEWDAVALSGRGSVASWIVSRHPTEPDAIPRLVALIDLEEGLRAVSNLVDLAPSAVRNDMPVVLTIRDYEGVLLPQFAPAGAGDE